jgi:alkylation response protein AidB-like acyl-CoA dehydrogenase
VLFEALGRVPYDGPYIESEVADHRRQQLAAHALEAVGIGSRAVEMAVAYIGEREQFGKKIGTYQAVSHPVVDSYVAIELARSLAYWAALCVATGDDQADVACAAANTQATEAGVRACETSIQVHGGIGFTFEHPLHRYYKRALELEGALGYGRELRGEIAQYLLSS